MIAPHGGQRQRLVRHVACLDAARYVCCTDLRKEFCWPLEDPSLIKLGVAGGASASAAGAPGGPGGPGVSSITNHLTQATYIMCEAGSSRALRLHTRSVTSKSPQFLYHAASVLILASRRCKAFITFSQAALPEYAILTPISSRSAHSAACSASSNTDGCSAQGPSPQTRPPTLQPPAGFRPPSQGVNPQGPGPRPGGAPWNPQQQPLPGAPRPGGPGLGLPPLQQAPYGPPQGLQPQHGGAGGPVGGPGMPPPYAGYGPPPPHLQVTACYALSAGHTCFNAGRRA